MLPIINLQILCAFFRGDVSGEMGDYLPIIDFGTNFSANILAVSGSGANHNCVSDGNSEWKCWGYVDCLLDM